MLQIKCADNSRRNCALSGGWCPQDDSFEHFRGERHCCLHDTKQSENVNFGVMTYKNFNLIKANTQLQLEVLSIYFRRNAQRYPNKFMRYIIFPLLTHKNHSSCRNLTSFVHYKHVAHCNSYCCKTSNRHLPLSPYHFHNNGGKFKNAAIR